MNSGFLTITIREILTANRTYYVRTDGDDNNNGLSNSPEGAFYTIQKALDIASSLDFALYDTTIQLGDGTYDQPLRVRSWVGAGRLWIQGNPTNPENTTITSSEAGATLFISGVTGTVCLRNFKLTNSGNSTTGLGVSAQSYCELHGGLQFGPCQASHITAYDGGAVWVFDGYSVVGGGASHMQALRNGIFHCLGGFTISVDGTPSFSNAFAVTRGGGVISAYNMTFSGTSTGVRYRAQLNGVILSFESGANFFPGNSPGVTATGGQYN